VCLDIRGFLDFDCVIESDFNDGKIVDAAGVGGVGVGRNLTETVVGARTFAVLGYVTEGMALGTEEPGRARETLTPTAMVWFVELEVRGP
jgi:hypothetical protein